MANFGPKLWVNPFGKMSVLTLSELFVFDRLQRRFFDVEYRKRDFPGLYCPKKLAKGPFLDQNNRLTRLKKCQCFDFLNFLFLWPRKAVF